MFLLNMIKSNINKIIIIDDAKKQELLDKKLHESIQIYTNISRKGAVGTCYIHIFKDKEEEVFIDSKNNLTSNQLQLQSVLLAFEKSKNMLNVKIYNNSTYVVNGFNEWMHTWKENGWKISTGKLAKNLDLWKELYECYKKYPSHELLLKEDN